MNAMTAPCTPPSFSFSKRTDALKASEIREILKITEREEVISFAGAGIVSRGRTKAGILAGVGRIRPKSPAVLHH